MWYLNVYSNVSMFLNQYRTLYFNVYINPYIYISYLCVYLAISIFSQLYISMSQLCILTLIYHYLYMTSSISLSKYCIAKFSCRFLDSMCSLYVLSLCALSMCSRHSLYHSWCLITDPWIVDIRINHEKNRQNNLPISASVTKTSTTT